MHYCNAPLVVGMYEFQLNRLTPEFIKDFNEYTSGKKFRCCIFKYETSADAHHSESPKSIHPQHNVSTFDEVATLLQQAERNPLSIIECICRKSRWRARSCEKTDRQRNLPCIGGMARTALLSGSGREITREEAMSIIETESETGIGATAVQYGKGRVHLLMLRMLLWDVRRSHKTLPKPLDFWASKLSCGRGPGHLRRMRCL